MRVPVLATPSGGSEMSSGAAIDNMTSSQSQAPDFFAGLCLLDDNVPTAHRTQRRKLTVTWQIQQTTWNR